MTKQRLGLFDFTMIMVSFVIGMGIFRTPVNVVAESPDAFSFFLAWFAGGLIAVCGALTYAEIGSRYPVTGGYYRIFSYAYHPSLAFGVNCIILISNAASLAGVALIGAEYISAVIIPESIDKETFKLIVAISAIVIFYGINLLGLKLSATAQNILTIIKIAMILMLILPLFTHAGELPASQSAFFSNATLKEYIKAFGLGLVAVSFTYGGYQQTINFGEEVKDPSRNVPRGIVAGLLIIIVLYLTVNYAYYRVIGFDALAKSENIAATMAAYTLGPAAGKVLSVLLFLSVLAYVNVLLMANPRVMLAMSEDGVLPKRFAKRNMKQVPLLALSVFAALCCVIVFRAKSFDQILSFAIFLDCIGMALSAATIFKLRKATAHLNGSSIYQMKLYPLLPVIFIVAYIFVALSIFIDKPMTALTGLGILGAFIGMFFLFTRIGSRR